MTLTLCKAVFGSAMTYACPAREFATDMLLLKFAAPARRCSPHDGKLSKAHIETRFACGSQTSEPMSARYTVVKAASRSVMKSWEWKCSPNWSKQPPNTGDRRRSNFASVKLMTVQMARLSL